MNKVTFWTIWDTGDQKPPKKLTTFLGIFRDCLQSKVLIFTNKSDMQLVCYTLVKVLFKIRLLKPCINDEKQKVWYLLFYYKVTTEIY